MINRFKNKTISREEIKSKLETVLTIMREIEEFAVERTKETNGWYITVSDARSVRDTARRIQDVIINIMQNDTITLDQVKEDDEGTNNT